MMKIKEDAHYDTWIEDGVEKHFPTRQEIKDDTLDLSWSVMNEDDVVVGKIVPCWLWWRWSSLDTDEVGYALTARRAVRAILLREKQKRMPS